MTSAPVVGLEDLPPPVTVSPAAVDAVSQKLGTTSIDASAPAAATHATLSEVTHTADPHSPHVVKIGHEDSHAQIVTPWDVDGSVSAGGKEL
ncbi:hypothetical protein JAAARDRAFT_56647 [Jaapia argillacea MUCL 33604]|uniref:Uncharacterized protein n=1 Tax=Jaapia argillacea MUCL 33604 TaxID=933084 RepID=A0A067PXW3_9AGAM|nr:hypothetical protein JAAARDRAFT_56647 [Jaapia argillacea MUCL 33604]